MKPNVMIILCKKNEKRELSQLKEVQHVDHGSIRLGIVWFTCYVIKGILHFD